MKSLRPRAGYAAAGLFISAVVWAVHQQTVYTLVPQSCRAQLIIIPFVTLVALLIIAGTALLSYRRNPAPHNPEFPDAQPRTAGFLSNISLLASGIFFMAVLLQGVASLILGSCER